LHFVNILKHYLVLFVKLPSLQVTAETCFQKHTLVESNSTHFIGLHYISTLCD